MLENVSVVVLLSPIGFGGATEIYDSFVGMPQLVLSELYSQK